MAKTGVNGDNVMENLESYELVDLLKAQLGYQMTAQRAERILEIAKALKVKTAELAKAA